MLTYALAPGQAAGHDQGVFDRELGDAEHDGVEPEPGAPCAQAAGALGCKEDRVVGPDRDVEAGQDAEYDRGELHEEIRPRAH